MVPRPPRHHHVHVPPHHTPADAPPAPDRRTVVGGCSLDCPDGCTWVVTVQQGRAVRLRGDATHPFTRGGLCAKVNPYLEYTADPDRVLHPLRRVAPKGVGGAGAFERTTWPEALRLLADAMRTGIAEHGPLSVWPYVGTGSVGWLQGCGASTPRLFNALGASRTDLDICSRSGTLGMGYTAGSPYGLEPARLADAAMVVLWGTNTLTTNLHLWPFVTRAREAGAPLVVVDPVRTRTAARADRHLAPRPGTDGALALGVMAHLVAVDAVDHDYLARRTLGWPRFRDEVVADWSTARAATVTGLDEAEIVWFADQYARRRPTGIRTLMGVQRHAGGGQAVRLMSCLPALVGDYDRVGGGLCYSTASAYAFDDAALTRPDLRPPGPTRALSASRLGEVLLTADPPVRTLVVAGANPVVSNPDQHRTRAGLLREGLFTAVVEHVLSDTTAYADLVLPGTTQVEHVELVESYSHVDVTLNQPAVAPAGEALPHTEIFRRLAHALHLHEEALQATDHDLVRAALSSGAPELEGITLERLLEHGWLRLAVPDPHVPFAERFATPSGRFEFTSARAARDGAGEMPHYLPPREAADPHPADGSPADAPSADAPSGPRRLALVSAANHYLVNSTFSSSRRHARAGAPVVVLHPQDAAAAHLADGDLADVGNARGTFRATVRVSDEVRPGVAATTKGLRPTPLDPGPDGSADATSVNATVSSGRSDLGGGALFHDNAVTVRPARRPEP